MKKYDDLSLRWKLTITFSLIITLLIVGIGFLSYYISVSNLEESEKELLESHLVLKERMFSTVFESMVRKTDLLFNSQLLQGALQEDYDSASIVDVVSTLDDLYNFINPIYDDLLSLNDVIQNRSSSGIKIRVYPFNKSFPVDGGSFHSYSAISGQSWVEEMYNRPRSLYWNSTHWDKGQRYISVNRIMRDFSSFEELGIISLMIPEKNILESLRQVPSDNSRLFIRTDSLPIIHSGSESIPDSFYEMNDESSGRMITGLLNNRKVLYGSLKLKVNNWHLFLIYPYDEITGKMETIKITTFLFLVLGLVISEILIWIISRKLTRRLEMMTAKFSQVTQNRLSPVAEISGNDEIGKLDRNFNKMIRDLNALIEKENGWELEKNSLTYELLQAQINPHLLYNTLATIEWMAKKGETANVQEITRKLIFFFKYYLNNGTLVTPVAEELRMIEEYIDIFIFTYRLNCQVDFQINTDLDSYYSIKLFLQPLVENSLQHGIRPVASERKCSLVVKADREGEDLIFEIHDNGLGMSEEKLKSISGNRKDSPAGFGMLNVKKRLILYFGDKYGITVKSKEDEGTSVFIRIPALFEDELLGIVNKR